MTHPTGWPNSSAGSWLDARPDAWSARPAAGPSTAVPGTVFPAAAAAPGGVGARLGPEDVRALVEIGFSALMQGLDGRAEAIFAGVVAARPEAEAGRIGLALTHLYRGGMREAVALLRALPPTDAARLYLGLALLRLGDAAEARRLLDDVALNAADPAFSGMARALLEGADAR